MKRTTLLLFVTFFVSSSINCRKEPPPSDTQPSIRKQKTRPKTTKRRRRRPPKRRIPSRLTMVSYERAITRLSSCQIKGFHFDMKCPAARRVLMLTKQKNKVKNFDSISRQVFRKHLSHKSPTVRFWMVLRVARQFKLQKQDIELLVKQGNKEQDEAVLWLLLQRLKHHLQTDPGATKLVMASTTHKKPKARAGAFLALGAREAKGIKGALDKLLAGIDKDPVYYVRSAACSSAFRHADQRVFARYTELTAPAKDTRETRAVYKGCMMGLIRLWNDKDGQTSPLALRAFSLTMQRLAKKPYSKHRPSVKTVKALSRIPQLERAGKKTTPAWYNKARVAKLLTSIALDEKASPKARQAAVGSLKKLAATAQLSQLKSQLSKKKDSVSKRLASRIKNSSPPPKKSK